MPMKNVIRCIAGLILIMSCISCSHYYYPLGKTAKRAYKDNLKEKSKGYTEFVPVILPKDSLQAKQLTAPSPNFNIRTPVLVIIHHTAQDGCLESLRTLTNATVSGRVSAHYLICKDGTVYRIVSERYRAWQAGDSRWGSIANINSISLGIELDNNGHEPFHRAQIHSLLVLLNSIQTRYEIPIGNFIGHADVAPTRKQDPNTYFPWRKLAEHGYGFWADRSTLPMVPKNFDPLAALRLIGYDVNPTSAAIVAFKRHFVQEDISPELRPIDKRILYDIYLQYLYYGNINNAHHFDDKNDVLNEEQADYTDVPVEGPYKPEHYWY